MNALLAEQNNRSGGSYRKLLKLSSIFKQMTTYKRKNIHAIIKQKRRNNATWGPLQPGKKLEYTSRSNLPSTRSRNLYRTGFYSLRQTGANPAHYAIYKTLHRFTKKLVGVNKLPQQFNKLAKIFSLFYRLSRELIIRHTKIRASRGMLVKIILSRDLVEFWCIAAAFLKIYPCKHDMHVTRNIWVLSNVNLLVREPAVTPLAGDVCTHQSKHLFIHLIKCVFEYSIMQIGHNNSKLIHKLLTKHLSKYNERKLVELQPLHNAHTKWRT